MSKPELCVETSGLPGLKGGRGSEYFQSTRLRLLTFLYTAAVSADLTYMPRRAQ